MKRILCLLLAALLTLPLFTACSESKTNREDEPAKETAGSGGSPDQTPAEETEHHYYDDIAEKNLNGFGYRIISRLSRVDHDVQSFTDYGNNEIDAEELDGTQINDCVFNRNRELEKRYNFIFNATQIDLNPMNTVKTSILAQSDDYDAVVDSIGSMVSYEMFYNLDNLDDMNLSEPCWDQNVNRSLSVGNKHYVAVGDMLILDKKGTWCHLFNKPMAADLQLENLYDAVREGTWTMDKFYSMSQTAVQDLNGNGKLEETDRWGFLTESYNINILMFGGGTRFSSKNEEDYPVLDMMNDRTVEVFEIAHKIMADRDSSLSMSWSKNGAADCLKAFSEDRGLFYMTGIGTAMEFRYMDSDFGILPIPKYDEQQDAYYTSFSKYNSACVAVPVSCLNADTVGFILQATCLASTDTLKTTFYDTVLNGVTVRDPESRDMLDILFGNRVFDLLFINNWGSMADLYSALLSMDSNVLASAYKRREKATLRAIDEAIREYEKLD